MIAAQHHGSVRATPVVNNKIKELLPKVTSWVDKKSHLMSDQHHSHMHIGKRYSNGSTTNHLRKDYTKDNVHTNTTESFGTLLERAKQDVFHFMSTKHLKRYLHQFDSRWNPRIPEEKVPRKGKKKIVMRPMPVIDVLNILLSKWLSIDHVPH